MGLSIIFWVLARPTQIEKKKRPGGNWPMRGRVVMGSIKLSKKRRVGIAKSEKRKVGDKKKGEGAGNNDLK